MKIHKQYFRLLLVAVCIGMAWLCISCSDTPDTADNDTDIDAVLEILDKEIDNQPDYVEAYKVSLHRESQMLKENRTQADRLKALSVLAHKYVFFQSDSAFSYVDKATTLAREQNDVQAMNRLMRDKAIALGMSGLPWEAVALLDSLRACTHEPEMLAQLYATYYDVIDFFYGYRLPPQILTKLHQFTTAIADSLIKYEPSDKERLLRLNTTDHSIDENVIRLKKNLREATSDDESGIFAMVLSNKYQQMNDLARRDYYWTMAATFFVRSCRMDNEGLIRLAARLIEKRDYARASRYVDVAYAQAQFYGSRSRMLELSRLQNLLRMHDEKVARSQRIALWVGGSIVLVVIPLLLLLMLRLRRRIKSGTAQSEQNDEQIKTLAEEKRNLQVRINTLQETVAHFLSLSIDALFELSAFRSSVLHRLRLGETKQMLRSLESEAAHGGGCSHKLLRGFDVAFTRLFPGFVREVNNLLRADSRITLSEDELLNNELRCLAMLRIGINNSQRIATILGISVNTVYFYRNRLKNKALRRDTFEDEVMHIGE